MSEHNLTTLELSNGFSSSSLKKQKLVDINQHSPKNAAPTYNLENAHKEENSAEELHEDHDKGLPLNPYYPTHFLKGTQLSLDPLTNEKPAEGTTLATKRVELLQAADFFDSASRLSSNHVNLTSLKMDTGAVRSLKLQPCRKTLKIEVEKEDSVGMSKGEFQCPVEYPLFCTNDSKGWTSFDPRKTLNLYGLECKQLQVEDTFILLADHQQ